MVKQYGDWVYVNNDPTNDEEVKAMLIDSMNWCVKEAGIDISQAKTELIFKEIPDHLKPTFKLELNKEWWSAAWKVTL